MRHFAANYIFDGKSLIKNSIVSVDDSGLITFVGKENDALIERPRMFSITALFLRDLLIHTVTLNCQITKKPMNKLKDYHILFLKS